MLLTKVLKNLEIHMSVVNLMTAPLTVKGDSRANDCTYLILLIV